MVDLLAAASLGTRPSCPRNSLCVYFLTKFTDKNFKGMFN